MGFSTGKYATVWEVKKVKDNATDIQISCSRKNQKTGEYQTEFSGTVRCYGAECAAQAAKLQRKDRIKIGDIDVTNSYDKEKKVGYTNFKMFSFEKVDNSKSSGGSYSNNRSSGNAYTKTHKTEYIQPDEDDSDLPF